ncbi:TRAP transporter small permease [Tropicimonas sp. IMCC34011]|uniref:TRAP transporter small permease n=1 Tax=Tropicimonas sp. IMCC34011 TaxID=2248759 RepID=UPI0013009571|nr:TRAP transporter small permease [Tropicimonas sp. IMCC34011]
METDARKPAPLTRRALQVQSLAVCVALLIMVGITCVDVIGRYLFNAPLAGAYEATQLQMTVLIFLGLPLVTLRDAHVKIDFLAGRLSQRARRVQRAVIGVATALVLIVLAWKLAQLGARFARHGDATIYGNIPYAPFVYVDAALAALSALAALAVAWRGPLALPDEADQPEVSV